MFDAARDLPHHRVVGTGVAWRVHDDELLVSVDLLQSVEAKQIGREAWIGGYHYGTPLGCDIQPRFDGTREDGLVEISVFDKSAQWTPGTLARQGPLFIGLELAVPK